MDGSTVYFSSTPFPQSMLTGDVAEAALRRIRTCVPGSRAVVKVIEPALAANAAAPKNVESKNFFIEKRVKVVNLRVVCYVMTS